MRVIDASNPDFYKAASVIKEYLPRVEITERHQILCDDGRYYGLLYVIDGVATYDHVIIDKTVSNPEFIFMVLTYIFSQADICNVFIESDNGASQHYTAGLGFVYTGVLRQLPSPLVIYSMTEQEWQTNRIRQHFIKRLEKQS